MVIVLGPPDKPKKASPRFIAKVFFAGFLGLLIVLALTVVAFLLPEFVDMVRESYE